MKKRRIFFISLILSLLLIFGLASCGTNASTSSESKNSSNSNSTAVIDDSSKVIYSFSYVIYDDDFTTLISKIGTELQTLNGYVVYSNQEEQMATYEYKVPVEQTNAFMNYIDSNANVTYKNSQSEDVTSEYNDIESQIETLESRRAAYIKMQTEQTLTLEEILQLNDRIDSLNAQIKSLYAEKARLDSVVDYSTFTVTYYVSAQTESSVYWSNYFSYLITIGKVAGSVLLYTIPFAVVAGVVVAIVFAVRKKKKQ